MILDEEVSLYTLVASSFLSKSILNKPPQSRGFSLSKRQMGGIHAHWPWPI